MSFSSCFSFELLLLFPIPRQFYPLPIFFPFFFLFFFPSFSFRLLFSIFPSQYFPVVVLRFLSCYILGLSGSKIVFSPLPYVLFLFCSPRIYCLFEVLTNPVCEECQPPSSLSFTPLFCWLRDLFFPTWRFFLFCLGQSLLPAFPMIGFFVRFLLTGNDNLPPFFSSPCLFLPYFLWARRPLLQRQKPPPFPFHPFPSTSFTSLTPSLFLLRIFVRAKLSVFPYPPWPQRHGLCPFFLEVPHYRPPPPLIASLFLFWSHPAPLHLANPWFGLPTPFLPNTIPTTSLPRLSNLSEWPLPGFFEQACLALSDVFLVFLLKVLFYNLPLRPAAALILFYVLHQKSYQWLFNSWWIAQPLPSLVHSFPY